MGVFKFLKDFFWIPEEPSDDIDYLNRRLFTMALNFEKLAEEVKQVQSTQASAIQVITTLKEELKNVADKLANQEADTSELDDLINKLDASTNDLAKAIAPAE